MHRKRRPCTCPLVHWFGHLVWPSRVSCHSMSLLCLRITCFASSLTVAAQDREESCSLYKGYLAQHYSSPIFLSTIRNDNNSNQRKSTNHYHGYWISRLLFRRGQRRRVHFDSLRPRAQTTFLGPRCLLPPPTARSQCGSFSAPA